MGQTVTLSVAAVLVAAILTSGIVYSCSNLNSRYYELASRCIAEGGTFAPSGRGDYSAMCIRGNK